MRVPSDDELDAAARWIGERLTVLLASIPDDQAYTTITPHRDRGRFGEGRRPRTVEVTAGKTAALTNIGRWYSYE